MRPDVEELEAFYASRQGGLARRLIGHQLRQLWPDLRGRSVLGMGYPTPYLPGLEGAERTLAVLPAAQGCAPWPTDGPGRTVLASEDDLPFADGAVDRVLLIHGLECSANPPRLMREIWRVLADGGRLIAVLPNRRGLWCWSDRTPFGYGRPYSAAQLARTLDGHLFEPAAERWALFLPPARSRLALRLAIPAERLGLTLARRFAGVIMVEAEKRIYLAHPGGREAARGRRYVTAPQSLVAARGDRVLGREASAATGRDSPVRRGEAAARMP